MPINDTTEIDLGSLLLEKKLITEDQLKECLEKQRLKGGYLSQHLIEQGYLQDSDLTTYLTCQYGFCYLPLNAYSITENTFDIIPAQLVYDYCCVPIEKNDRLLTVVMADPLNKGVIEALRQISQCEIIVFISTRKEIRGAIEKYYSASFKEIDLDRFQDDPLLRDNLSRNSYIRTPSYTGPNRRRYARWKVELPAKYYLYPNILGTKIKNIGMSGICFGSYMPLAKGTQMAMTIHLDNERFFTAVVEVARCESKNTNGVALADTSLALYEASAFFNFLSEEHQLMLADFLKKLPSA